MNRTTTIALVSLSFAGTLPAAQPAMVAGWDFAQYAGVNFNVVSASPVFVNTLAANYSDYDPTFGAGAESAAFGTMYWNGNYGSTGGTATNPADAGPFSGSLANNLLPGAGVGFDAHSVLDAEGFAYSNFLSFTVKDTFGGGEGALVFAATPGEVHSDWQIRFAGTINGSGTAAVAVSFSTDGATYTQLGTAVFTTTDTLYTYSVPKSASSTGYFKFGFSGLAGTDNPVIDNVSIHATPGSGTTSGTFWAASPVLPSGWRATGEGYPGEVGIGYIWDGWWPYVYSLSMATREPDGWIWIDPSGSRASFFAWVYGGAYWIYGVSTVGYYYSWEPGNSGWFAF